MCHVFHECSALLHTKDPRGRPLSYTEIRQDSEQSNMAVKRDALAVAQDGADVLEQAGVTAHVESIGTIGAAWFPIIERLQNPDVAAIVVGTHARSHLRSLWLGSVSYNVIHHTTKPVLIVHTGADDRDASHCG